MTDTTSQQLEPRDLEHSTSYEETQSWRTPAQPRPQRPRAPTLPNQTSQGSSTRSIPPSSSAHTSPTHPTFQPTRTRQPSRGSSTLASPPPSALPSTENGARTGSHAAPRLPVSEKPPRGENSQRAHTPPQGRAPTRLPALREEHRFCRRCSIIKPPRTHHCRACGTVRLISFRFVRTLGD